MGERARQRGVTEEIESLSLRSRERRQTPERNQIPVGLYACVCMCERFSGQRVKRPKAEKKKRNRKKQVKESG